jgi:thiol:disulfide interchange protein DsbD
MRADWTKQDPIIGATLAKYGRNSVPLYLYFPPNSELPGSRRTKSRGDSSQSKDYPKILPQILTFEILRSAIETSSN